MQKFSVAVVLAVCLPLISCGPVKEPALVDPVFKEIDCVAEPYHFQCRQPSTEQPVL